MANSAWYLHNFRTNLVRAIQSAGWTVTLVAPVDDFIHHIYRLPQVKFVPLEHLKRKSVNPIYDLRLFKELKDVYRSLKPDLIIHYTIKPNLYGTAAARALKIKTIAVIPGLGYTFVKKGVLRNIVESAYRYFLPYAKFVIFENSSDRDYFVNAGILEDKRAKAFQGCGVDMDHFIPLSPSNGRVKGPVFLFMGRLIAEKGIYEFVEAGKILLEDYPSARFWILGHIDEDNPSAIPHKLFVEWISNKSFHYLGFHEDVRTIIREVDCVILPSYYPEGIPRVLQEAMAMEKVIITTDTYGCREAVEAGKNGFLVKPRDVDSLVRAMERICRMEEEELIAMGKHGREMAKLKFDESISIKRYLECMTKAMA